MTPSQKGNKWIVGMDLHKVTLPCLKGTILSNIIYALAQRTFHFQEEQTVDILIQ